jgi:hypothetical protein
MIIAEDLLDDLVQLRVMGLDSGAKWKKPNRRKGEGQPTVNFPDTSDQFSRVDWTLWVDTGVFCSIGHRHPFDEWIDKGGFRVLLES